MRQRRPALAGLMTVLTCLVTPVCGAFLLSGCSACCSATARVGAVVVIGVAGLGLLAIAAYFGSLGPEGFRVQDFLSVFVAAIVLLVLRPSPTVRVVVLLSIVVCIGVAVVPNGLGSNFQRMIWFCLPVACAATSTARRRLTALALVPPLVLAVIVTVRDLHVAAQPMSRASYYDGVTRKLDSLPGLQGYRTEVVPDGTHTVGYALLGHTQQARGYETQSDKLYHHVLTDPDLDAAKYRSWLNFNAVAYVIIGRRTLDTGPEFELVSRRTPS